MAEDLDLSKFVCKVTSGDVTLTIHPTKIEVESGGRFEAFVSIISGGGGGGYHKRIKAEFGVIATANGDSVPVQIIQESQQEILQAIADKTGIPRRRLEFSIKADDPQR